MKIELIGGKTCPFVHRIQILLNFFQLPHTSKYIDLHAKPDWFLKISPLNKVPLLLVDDKTILFESAVIAEYLDEISHSTALPEKPEEKAFCRAWIEFGNRLVGSFHSALWEAEETYQTLWAEVHVQLTRLNAIKGERGQEFFISNNFSLVDSAFASVFLRMSLLDTQYDFPVLSKYKNLLKWQDKLIHLPYVIKGHPDNFNDLWQQRVEQKSLISKSKSNGEPYIHQLRATLQHT